MTQVIINDILPRTQLVASLGQTLYSTDWTANYASDVVVYSRTANAPVSDVSSKLDPSLYNVAFIGDQLIVQVTLINPSAAGDIVTIIRDTPADRENLYTNTNFTPSMLNNDFGILTLVDQQNQLVNQEIAPRYDYSAIIQPVTDTILPVLLANQFWIKNPNNTAIIPFTLTTQITQWISTSLASIQAAVGMGIATLRTSTPVQIELPPTFKLGDVVEVIGYGAGGWSLVANAGQIIQFGSFNTSVAGAINSDVPQANIKVRGLIANSIWTVELVNTNPTYI